MTQDLTDSFTAISVLATAFTVGPHQIMDTAHRQASLSFPVVKKDGIIAEVTRIMSEVCGLDAIDDSTPNEGQFHLKDVSISPDSSFGNQESSIANVQLYVHNADVSRIKEGVQTAATEASKQLDSQSASFVNRTGSGGSSALKR